MSSSPAVPTAASPAAPAPKPITNPLSSDWSWLVHHLLLLVIVGGLIIAGVYGVESLVAKHDAAILARDNAVLAAQVKQNQDLLTEAQNKDAMLTQAFAALTTANAQLSAQKQARDQVLATQVQANATLSAQDAAARLTAQLQAAPGELSASGNDVTVDLPMSRQLVTDLDKLPVVQADLADTQKQLVNETQIVTATQSDLTAQKNVVGGLQTQLTDQQKACIAEVTAVKAKARKSKIKVFFIGLISGAIGLRLAGY